MYFNKFLLTLVVILLFNVTVAYTAVIYGTGEMDPWGWDFSLQEPAGILSGNPDILIAIVNDPGLGLIVSASMPPAIIIAVPDSTFEELKFAPADTTQYSWYAHAVENRTYVIRTLERTYAKFRLFNLPQGSISPLVLNLSDLDLFPGDVSIIKHMEFLFIAHATIPTIEYVYQPDGSTKLFDKVSVEEVSWGVIKQLMKH